MAAKAAMPSFQENIFSGIALSALLLGAAVMTQWRPPLLAAAALVGVFALFHGHAHGAELPPGGSGLLYSMGFVVATGSLHLLGIATAAGGNDQSVRVQLLDDIRAIFADRRVDRLPSAELVDALAAIEDRAWAEWKKRQADHGKWPSPRLLAPFGIAPETCSPSDRLPPGLSMRSALWA